MLLRYVLWLIVLAPAGAQTGSLRGYVFRETDGSPPRRPMTVELSQNGKARYRQTTQPDGSFEFSKVTEGEYTITPRYGDFVFIQDLVPVKAGSLNFATVMLPKRRGGASGFGTVSVERLDQRVNRQVQNKLKAADQKVRAHDFAGAVSLYEEALDLRPSAEVFDALALLHLQQGRKEEAYRCLEQAIAQDPKFLFSYTHLAAIYLDEKKYAEVKLVANRALEVDSRWAGGYMLLGEAELRLGNVEAAARHAHRADDLTQGKSPEPHLLLAKIRWVERNCAKAKEHLARFISLRSSAGEISRFQTILESCP